MPIVTEWQNIVQEKKSPKYCSFYYMPKILENLVCLYFDPIFKSNFSSLLKYFVTLWFQAIIEHIVWFSNE